jgi:hypothetical protein
MYIIFTRILLYDTSQSSFEISLGGEDHKITNNTTLQGSAEDACQALHATGSESAIQCHQRNLDMFFFH